MSQQIGAPLSSLPQEKKRSGEGKEGRNRIGQKGKPSLARQFAKAPSSRLEIVAHLKGASFFSHFYLLRLVQFSRFLLLGPWGVSSSRRGMVMDLPSQASQDAAAIRYRTRQWLNSQGQNMTNYSVLHISRISGPSRFPSGRRAGAGEANLRLPPPPTAEAGG